jgi:hypothetical protein
MKGETTMQKLTREMIDQGMGALGYMPPDRVTDPDSPMSLAPLGFREAVCRAAGWDAGNRAMREAGRTAWSADDYNAAAREYERLVIR